jgi:hypothetical protein
MGVHICNSSSQEAEAEGAQVQGWSGLNSEFQDSLACILISCLKKKKKGGREEERKEGKKEGREGKDYNWE